MYLFSSAFMLSLVYFGKGLFLARIADVSPAKGL